MSLRGGWLLLLGLLVAFNRRTVCGRLPPAPPMWHAGMTKDNLQMLAAMKKMNLDGTPSFKYLKHPALGKRSQVFSKTNQELGQNSLSSSDFGDNLSFTARNAYIEEPYNIPLEAKSSRYSKTTMISTTLFFYKSTTNSRSTSLYSSTYSNGNPVDTFSVSPLAGTNSHMFYTIFPKFLKRFGCEIYASLQIKSELDRCFKKALIAYHKMNYGLLQALLPLKPIPDYRRVTIADHFIEMLSSMTSKHSDLVENWEADSNLIDNANTGFRMLNKQMEVPWNGPLEYKLASKGKLEEHTTSMVMSYAKKTTQCGKECSGSQNNDHTYPEHTAVPFTTLERNLDHLIVKAKAHSIFSAPLYSHLENALASNVRIEIETTPVVAVAHEMVIPYTNEIDDHAFPEDLSVAFTTLEQNLDYRTVKAKGLLDASLNDHPEYRQASKGTLKMETKLMPLTNEKDDDIFPEESAGAFSKPAQNLGYRMDKEKEHSMFVAPKNSHPEYTLAFKGKFNIETKPVHSVPLGMVMTLTNEKDYHTFPEDMALTFSMLKHNLDYNTVKAKGHSMFAMPLNGDPKYRLTPDDQLKMEAKPVILSIGPGMMITLTNKKDALNYSEDVSVAFHMFKQNLTQKMNKSKEHSRFAEPLNSPPEYTLASKVGFKMEKETVQPVAHGIMIPNAKEEDNQIFSEDTSVAITTLEHNLDRKMVKEKGLSLFTEPLKSLPENALTFKYRFKMQTKPVLYFPWGLGMQHTNEKGKDDHTLPEDMTASFTTLEQNFDEKTKAKELSMLASPLNNHPEYTLESKVGFETVTESLLSGTGRVVTPQTNRKDDNTIPEDMSTAIPMFEQNLDGMSFKAKGHSVFDAPLNGHLKNERAFNDGFKLEEKPVLSISPGIVMQNTNDQGNYDQSFPDDMEVVYSTLEQNLDSETAKVLSMLTSPMKKMEWTILDITPKLHEIEQLQNVDAQKSEYTIDDNEDVNNNINNQSINLLFEGCPLKGIKINILPILGEDNKKSKTLFPIKLNVGQPELSATTLMKTIPSLLTNRQPIIQSNTLTSRWLTAALLTTTNITVGRMSVPKRVSSTIFLSIRERQTESAKVKQHHEMFAEGTSTTTFTPFELYIKKTISTREKHVLASSGKETTQEKFTTGMMLHLVREHPIELLSTSLLFVDKYKRHFKLTSHSQNVGFKSNQLMYTRHRTFGKRAHNSEIRIHRKNREVTYRIKNRKQKREIRDFATGTYFLYFSDKLEGVKKKTDFALLNNPYSVVGRIRRSFADDDNSELFPVKLQQTVGKTQKAQTVQEGDKFRQIQPEYQFRSANEQSSNDGTVLLPVGVLNHLSSALLAGSVIIGFIFFGCILGLVWLLHKDSKLCTVLGRCLSRESLPNRSGSHHSSGQPTFKYVHQGSSGRSQVQETRSPSSSGVKEIHIKEDELQSKEREISTDSLILHAPTIQARKSFHSTANKKPIVASIPKNYNNSGKEHIKVYTLQFSDSGSRLLTDGFNATRSESKCPGSDGNQYSPIQKRILYDTSDQEFISSSESVTSCCSRSSFKSVSRSTSDQDSMSIGERLSSRSSRSRKIAKEYVLLSKSFSDDPYVRQSSRSSKSCMITSQALDPEENKR